MQSRATTVEQYLAELPEDRRRAIAAVRRVILEYIDQDFEEGMQYGMISYYVPHSLYPPGYHCDPRQPLPYLCLASQKNYMSLYAMSLYGSADQANWFMEAWKKTGKKLDMGKSCIRFKKVEDLALEVIGEAIRRVPVQKYIATYEAARQSTRAVKTRKAPKARLSAKSKGVAKPVKKRRKRP